MKIYIVTSGIYSDYCIRRVFTNKEKAEEYREWLHDSNEVEEYDTSDDIPTEKKYCVCCFKMVSRQVRGNSCLRS